MMRGFWCLRAPTSTIAAISVNRVKGLLECICILKITNKNTCKDSAEKYFLILELRNQNF